MGTTFGTVQTLWQPLTCCVISRVYRSLPEENMMRKLHSLVVFLLLPVPLCVEATALQTPKFIYHSNSLSWKDAQAFCRNHYTDLVTIRNQEDNEDFIYGQGWIGLYREDLTSEWKWSKGGETANFTIWESNDQKKAENCAFKYNSVKQWQTDSCKSRHSFMCYDVRLVLVQEKKTWEEALEHCRALQAVDHSKPPTAHLNHLYDLASLQGLDDHHFAREKAHEATTNKVWTGLRFLAGQWVWVGGEEVQYQQLPHCPVQRHCGALDKNGTRAWEINHCMERRNFLCYKKP